MVLEVSAEVQERIQSIVKHDIIENYFEVDGGFEIITAIRYDPCLTHLFPQSVSIDLDPQLNFDEFCDSLLNTDNEVGSYIDFFQYQNRNYAPSNNNLKSILMKVFGVPNYMQEITYKSLRSVFRKRFFLLSEHHKRLNLSLIYFGWDFEIPFKLLLDKLIEALPCATETTSLNERMEKLANVNQCYKMRVLINEKGLLRVEPEPLPVLYHNYLNINQYFVETLLSGFLDVPIMWDVFIDTEPIIISPFTTFKTTKREQYNEARSRMLKMSSTLVDPRPNCDILVYNDAYQLMEGSIMSVAAKKFRSNGSYEYITPPLSSGCLCSVTRHYLLNKQLIQEDMIDIRTLSEGSEVLLFNAIRGCAKGIIRNSFQSV